MSPAKTPTMSGTFDGDGFTPNKPECSFDDWWRRTGKSIDPDTSDVPWEDKRKALAEAAFDAALAMSRNYVANDDTWPTTVIFANGRAVRIASDADTLSLRISK